MNGQARRVGYRFQGGLCSASARDGGGSTRESSAAIEMDQGRFDFEPRGRGEQ